MVSKATEFSEFLKDNYKLKGNPFSHRRCKYGVGINDADYITSPVINGRSSTCPAYNAWHEMIKRSYCHLYKEKHPSYKEVSVCNEWLYFSEFRKWFINNHVDNYQLDKDLLYNNDKIYSPETCIYVPQWLNVFIINRQFARGDCVIGVHWDKTKKKYVAQCSNPVTKKREHLGYFNDEVAAHNAWLSRKLELSLELKPDMDEIDLRIYPNIVEIIKSMQ